MQEIKQDLHSLLKLWTNSMICQRFNGVRPMFIIRKQTNMATYSYVCAFDTEPSLTYVFSKIQIGRTIEEFIFT